MRKILAAAALFGFALPAFAAPMPFKGDYVFKNRVNVLGRNTVDVIDTRRRDATERLNALRQAGSACQWVNSNTVRCVTQSPAVTVPSSSVSSVVNANQGMKVSFGALRGTPSVVSQGTSLTEWSVPQDGQWAGGPFTQYRYLELAGGLSKLVLPGQQPLWLNTTDGKTLGVYQMLVVGEGRWRWHEDAMEVLLEQ